jgi:glycerophosphoryl diester phosphodiesterase
MRDWLTARPIAHRGLHDAASGVIENTASAFRAAIDGGYGIECDLQISADGEAMVHHDDALGRLTDGAGRLDTMTAEALGRIPFKASADRMMTLGGLCNLVAGRATLLIELKGSFAGDDRLAVRATDVLAGYHGPAALMSFDPGLIAPATQMSALRYAQQAMAARPQFLAYRVQDLTSPVPRLARNLLRMPLLTWTVRTSAERQRAAAYADQMIFEGFRPQ